MTDLENVEGLRRAEVHDRVNRDGEHGKFALGDKVEHWEVTGVEHVLNSKHLALLRGDLDKPIEISERVGGDEGFRMGTFID